MVVCHEDDVETVRAAEQAVAQNRLRNVFIETFSGAPGKPWALNVGTAVADFDVVCVFDAEDDVHPDIFDVANSAMHRHALRHRLADRGAGGRAGLPLGRLRQGRGRG